jgi:peroxiredoxin Q/BCP
MATKLQPTLREGDEAPAFTAMTTDGTTVSLHDFKGRDVILYFYPKDDTPGCTKEACAFRDRHAAFRKAGVVVLGISTDGVKSHAKFSAKYKLPFPLLSDEQKQIVSAYGAWGEKSFMGRKYQGTYRWTFWIDGSGKIRKIWTDVKPNEHADQILALLRAGRRQAE